MSCVLVTGASGFIGSSLIKHLLNKGDKVVALDLKRAGEDRLPNDTNLHFEECDIFDLDIFKLICEKYKPNIIYHFAWIGVGSSVELRSNYDLQIKNATNTVELMKIADMFGCSKFICAGSIMEYESIEAVYTQESRPNSAYLYGVAKSLAHSVCKIVANELKIKLIWAMITNTYGVGESSPRLINSTIKNCIEENRLQFTEAKQRYDFIYIDDVVEAFYLLGLKGKENKHYLIGSGNPKELRCFLLSIVKICNEKLVPEFGALHYTGVNTPEEDFSIDEIRKDCGFEPKISFEEGILRTYNWFKSMY